MTPIKSTYLRNDEDDSHNKEKHFLPALGAISEKLLNEAVVPHTQLNNQEFCAR